MRVRVFRRALDDRDEIHWFCDYRGPLALSAGYAIVRDGVSVGSLVTIVS